MAQFLKTIAVVAFVLCIGSALEAQGTALSADDTAAYINATLHKYPTLEFVDSGCPGDEQVVSISGDRRSLLIRQTFGKSVQGRCVNVQMLAVPIFSLNREQIGTWSKQGQHSSFFLDCINRVDCFSRQSEAQAFSSAENNWYLQITAPDQVSRQLKKAIQHLVDSLLAEASARVVPNDAFAKRAH